MAQYTRFPPISSGSGGTVTANQGTPNTLGNAWPVKPTDGTNSQSFTALGEAKVSITQPLPAGANALGSVSVSNFPASQAITGTVSVSNFPASQPISGTVNTNLNGLNGWQTSQVTVGTSAVQLDVSALANRTAAGVKALTTASNVIIYIGPSAAVTTSNGYPLFNGDSAQVDIKTTGQIWAIATVAGQTASLIEVGG